MTPQPNPAAIMFWLFAALAVAGSIAMITRRNLVSAVMWLVGTIVALAALYAMLFAHFLAAIQVLVYAGAIMVLFVFVIMILNKEEEDPWALSGIVGKGVACLSLGYLVFRLLGPLWDVQRRIPERAWASGEQAQFGTTRAVGRELFTTYLFPFEMISLVLLVAVIGAVVLGRGSQARIAAKEGPPAP